MLRAINQSTVWQRGDENSSGRQVLSLCRLPTLSRYLSYPAPFSFPLGPVPRSLFPYALPLPLAPNSFLLAPSSWPPSFPLTALPNAPAGWQIRSRSGSARRRRGMRGYWPTTPSLGMHLKMLISISRAIAEAKPSWVTAACVRAPSTTLDHAEEDWPRSGRIASHIMPFGFCRMMLQWFIQVLLSTRHPPEDLSAILHLRNFGECVISILNSCFQTCHLRRSFIDKYDTYSPCPQTPALRSRLSLALIQS